MAYDEHLARRVRPLLALRRGFSEKRMFGGIAYFLNGNLCAGVSKHSLFVRVGAEAYESTLAEAYVSVFGPAKRPMRGWVLIAPEGLEEIAAIRSWIDRAASFVETLPAKE
jgi:TfoX/Sxy family transcriptional regulator of competence genes